MQTTSRIFTALIKLTGATGFIVLAGCTPMMAGQMAESGYNVAKTALGSGPNASATGADQRQKDLQAKLNAIEVGQDVTPLIENMGEAPKEKSGNSYGFICYEYSAVYSATDAAVIVAKNNKVVFYGNSRCNLEMQDVNFRKDGKYMLNSLP